MVPTSVDGVGTKVFVSGPAELADPASVTEPRDSNPLTEVEALGIRSRRHYLTDDLVPRRDVLLMDGQVTLGHVKVGMADPAGQNLD